ncbi:hypothetical protein HDU78_010150 [Chytriomyces hyalinus]|nr:hypothetical protein HDU78_010150 [Chytriomyces hyalinus]
MKLSFNFGQELVLILSPVQIPITDKAAIFGSVRAFGGQYRTELTPDTTHLVTLTMTPPITKTALTQSKLPQPFDHPHLIKSASNEPTGNGLKLILPHYFDDCVKVKRRVHEDLYLFPEPKLFAVWDDVGPLGSASGCAASFMTQDTSLVSDDVEFLKDHIVFIHTDCESLVTARMRQDVEKFGGTLSVAFSPLVTIAILLERDGDEYIQSEKNGKLVGTPRWLKEILRQRQITSPKEKALHYPRPAPLESFQNLRICATNYVGQCRADIETMITDLGAIYTRQMTRENTHVICARPYSEKHAHALEWDLTVVNHLWLEDCYSQRNLMNPARNSYLYYPPFLPRIVGNTHIPSEQIAASLASAEKRLKASRSGTKMGSVKHAKKDVISAEKVDSSFQEEIHEAKVGNDTTLLEDVAEDPIDGGVEVPNVVAKLSPQKPPTRKYSSLSKKKSVLRESTGSSHDVNAGNQATPRAASNNVSTASTTAGKRTPPGNAPTSLRGFGGASAKSSPASSHSVKPKLLFMDNRSVGELEEAPHLPGLIKLPSIKSKSSVATPVSLTSLKESMKPGTPSIRINLAKTNSALPSARSTTRDGASVPEPALSKLQKPLSKMASSAAIIVDLDPDSPVDEEERERAVVETVARSLSLKSTRKSESFLFSRSSAVSTGSVGGLKRRRSDGVDKVSALQVAGGARAGDKRMKMEVAVICTGGTRIEKAVWKEAQNSLGARDAPNLEACTHLVTNKIVRTEKFIGAITLGKQIVTGEWVAQSVRNGHWMKPSDFRPVDDSPEYSAFSIDSALALAQKRKLLEGYNVYATPQVNPDVSTIKRLVEYAGGKMIKPISQRKLASGDIRMFTLPSRNISGIHSSSPSGGFASSAESSMSGEVDASKVLIITCEADQASYHERLRSFGFQLYSVEVLIGGLMHQRLDLEGRFCYYRDILAFCIVEDFHLKITFIMPRFASSSNSSAPSSKAITPAPFNLLKTPASNQESQYLQAAVGKALVAGITQILATRCEDPVDALGRFLLKHYETSIQIEAASAKKSRFEAEVKRMGRDADVTEKDESEFVPQDWAMTPAQVAAIFQAPSPPLPPTPHAPVSKAVSRGLSAVVDQEGKEAPLTAPHEQNEDNAAAEEKEKVPDENAEQDVNGTELDEAAEEVPPAPVEVTDQALERKQDDSEIDQTILHLEETSLEIDSSVVPEAEPIPEAAVAEEAHEMQASDEPMASDEPAAAEEE